jgi:hypothetical protein
MNSMIEAMQVAFDQAAMQVMHVSDTAPEIEEDDEVSEHQAIYDDMLTVSEEPVMDAVYTPEERRKMNVLRRAGWLKDQGDMPELRRTAADLLAERKAKFHAIRRIVKRSNV